MKNTDLAFLAVLFLAFIFIIILFFMIGNGDENVYENLKKASTDKIIDLIPTPAGNTILSSINSPNNVKTNIDNNDNVIITWNPVMGADSYIIYQSLQPNFSYDQVITFQKVYTEKSTLALISSGQSNYFRIATVIGAYESAPSYVVSASNNYTNVANDYFIIQLTGSSGLNNVIYFDSTNTHTQPYNSVNQIVQLQNGKMTLPFVNNQCIGITNYMISNNCNSKWIYSDEQFCIGNLCLTDSGIVLPGINVKAIQYRSNQFDQQKWYRIIVAPNLFLTPYFYIFSSIGQNQYPLISGTSTNDLIPIIVGSSLNDDTILAFYFVDVITNIDSQNRKYYSGYLYTTNYKKSNYGSIIVKDDKIYIASPDTLGTLFSIYEYQLKSTQSNKMYSTPTTFLLLDFNMMWIITNTIGSQIYVSDISNSLDFTIAKSNILQQDSS